MNKLLFSFAYWFQKPRWDTNVTPPEVVEHFKTLPNHGHALDIGCGTGTNCIYMAQHGWQVTGIDFVNKAIRTAQKKIHEANLDSQVNLILGDVTQMTQYSIKPAQYALDMGCFHGLPPEGRTSYVAALSTLLEPEAMYMLLAHQPGKNHGQNIGVDIPEIRERFSDDFKIIYYEEDSKPQLWYWLQKK